MRPARRRSVPVTSGILATGLHRHLTFEFESPRRRSLRSASPGRTRNPFAFRAAPTFEVRIGEGRARAYGMRSGRSRRQGRPPLSWPSHTERIDGTGVPLVSPPTYSRYGVPTDGDLIAQGRRPMTAKSDFTNDEWQLILEAPPTAGMIVVTAQRGGMFRESVAMAKAYVEARQHHGESELLDAIVAAKPERDHTHYHSPDELKQHGLQHLPRFGGASRAQGHAPGGRRIPSVRRHAVQKVATAHREHGQDVSDAEQAAINDITEALNTAAG